MAMIMKRDDRIVPFSKSKIVSAVLKAFKAVDGETSDYAEEKASAIADYVESVAQTKTLTVEEIQDMVEAGLGKTKRPDVAKAYILYRNQRAKARARNSAAISYKDLVNSYVKLDDWRVKENSTVTYSVGGLILSNSGAVTANYWLSEVYDEEIANAHREADIHIHDLSMLTGYCAGWSLRQLLQEGLGGVPGRITSAPAKHLSTLCNQMVNFLGIMQNEWAGAQAFSSFDTYLAPFVKSDGLTYKQTKQCIQSFIYGVNTPSRWGTQAPFTNVTLDWTVPADLAKQHCIIGGAEADFTYADCQKEMDMVNKAFIEIMIEGDANGRGFQYPIPTYSITKDFDWEENENNRLLFEMTAKYGIPYFSNYINSDMEPSDVRSMCPLIDTTKVLVRNTTTNKVLVRTIKELYSTQNSKNTSYEVWTGKRWSKAKINAVSPTPVYKITMSNGTTVTMGENHLQPTMKNGTLPAKLLTTDMWLPFNKNTITTEEIGSFELGYAVGAYIGDGSHDDSSITYSLDAKEKDDLTIENLKKFWNNLGYTTNITLLKNNCRNFRVNGNPYSIISEYIEGRNALDKALSQKVWGMSEDFKIGLIEGFRATDGCRDRRRLYTSSDTLRHQMVTLFMSLGKKSLINYVDTRENRLGSNPNYRIDYPERPNYGELYKSDNSFNYYKIIKIEKMNNDKLLYCFEVEDDSHLFTIASGLITHNCRLRLDLRELRRKSGGFFGSGESTGSIGVVTINLPKIAYLAEDKEDFYNKLDKLMDISARSLKVKRETITKLLEAGLYPYTKRYLGTFNNHFSTIGLVGMNEVGLNAKWLKKDLTNKETQNFAIEVLNHMRERLSDYQEEYGDLYNLEATPAESTSYRLAKHDKEKYPDIITANDASGVYYYTNSSHLPVSYTSDIFEALDVQDELQTLYTSGTVFHTFLGERLPDWRACANLVRKIAENYKLPYYTISPTYSVCPIHGYIPGEVHNCPRCHEPTESYSRITGYYRPIQNWNDGKTQEFKDRKTYDIGNSKFKKEETNNIKQQKDKEELPTETILFTTHTCPKCKMVKTFADARGFKYKTVYADDNLDVARKYNIQSVPVLIANGEKYDSVNAICSFIESNKE